MSLLFSIFNQQKTLLTERIININEVRYSFFIIAFVHCQTGNFFSVKDCSSNKAKSGNSDFNRRYYIN